MPFMTNVRPKVAEILTSGHDSCFDQEQDQLVRSLNKSRRNIERSIVALDGIARAEAGYQNIEGQVVGARRALLSAD